MNAKSDTFGYCVVALFIVAILILAGWFKWYRAEVQADLWRREGIQISTWEVMMGAKPAQRLIEVKP